MYANVCTLSLFLTWGHMRGCPSRWQQSWVFHFTEQTPPGRLSSPGWSVSVSGSRSGSSQTLLLFWLWLVTRSRCCFGCWWKLVTLHRQRKHRVGVWHSVNQTHPDHTHAQARTHTRTHSNTHTHTQQWAAAGTEANEWQQKENWYKINQWIKNVQTMMNRWSLIVKRSKL